MSNTIANLAAVPSLVRAALLRSLRRFVAMARLADNVRLVLWLARWQPIAKRMWLLHRAATCSNAGPMRTNYRAEGLAVSVEQKARAAA